MSEENGLSLVYALRILPRAERDINAHVVRMADTSGPDVAREWHTRLFGDIATLAQNPNRRAAVVENRHFRQDVRQILYRRTPAGPAWRVLFVIDEASEDGPTVNVLHVRHAAQRPISRAEAREIETDQ